MEVGSGAVDDLRDRLRVEDEVLAEEDEAKVESDATGFDAVVGTSTVASAFSDCLRDRRDVGAASPLPKVEGSPSLPLVSASSRALRAANALIGAEAGVPAFFLGAILDAPRALEAGRAIVQCNEGRVME